MVEKNGSLLFFGIFLILFCEETASECRQLTACSCTFSNGRGYSLSPLNDSQALKVTEGNYTFYFHPCSNKQLTDNDTSECYRGNGVSLCMEQGKSSFNLGTATDTRITAESDNSKPPLLTIGHGGYETSIALVCCNVCNKTYLMVDYAKPDSKEYRLVLTSPYACETFTGTRGLSTGSVLLVYFFVFTGIYFIGGAVALKLLRGATGWEMLPNHKFWRELPSLVKEGIFFTFDCCRTTSYETI